jgi:putative DNA-invertase from lambdoid prophage Rac
VRPRLRDGRRDQKVRPTSSGPNRLIVPRLLYSGRQKFGQLTNLTVCVHSRAASDCLILNRMNFVHDKQGRRLYDKLRRGDTLVVRWVDRLGRNYEDVCDTIRHFMRRGVVISTVINAFTFDGATKDPMQQAVRDALIAFMAATAQAQAEATKAAQRAGIEHAKQQGDRAYLGRKPSFTRAQLAKVRNMLGQEAVGIARIAKETGLTRQTVYRIKDDPASAEAALVAWSM